MIKPIIKDEKTLYEAWGEYTEKRKAFSYYLVLVNDETYHSNAPSSFIYDFARTKGLKVGILWDERQELYIGFTEFKIFLYHSFTPKQDTINKWIKIEEEIIMYVQEKNWWGETPDYQEAYNLVLNKTINSGNPILFKEVDEFDSLLRAYIETPLKTDYPEISDELLNRDSQDDSF